MKGRVTIYCVDQDLSTTSSIGIYNYTAQLIRHLATLPDPGFQLTILGNEFNRSDFYPDPCPSWMKFEEVKGRYGKGLKRLFADQIIAAVHPAILNSNLVHFPKGWLPQMKFGNAKRMVTLHDTIVQYYIERYPQFHPAKMKYFDRMTRHALKAAHSVITVSNSSATDLSQLNPDAASKIEVIPEGPGIKIPDEPYTGEKSGIMIYGSELPHKATREAIILLDKWMSVKNNQMPVSIIGMGGWIAEWGDAPTNLQPNYLGRVPQADLGDLMARHKLFVMLSEIEGLGLPVLEAYLCGTPVCYRNRSALAEVMQGAPGGWDGESEVAFFESIEEVLQLSDEDIARVASDLKERYNWADGAAQTAAIYNRLLT